MALICSIFALSTALLPLADEEEPPEGGLFMNQRIARKPTRATARSWGMLIEVCEACAMVGEGSGCKQALGGCGAIDMESERCVGGAREVL